MSDALGTIVMAGVVQLGLGILTYLTLRAKLHYSTEQNEAVTNDAMSAVRKADSAVAKADDAVEKAGAVSDKADTAVRQSTRIAVDTSNKVSEVISKIDDNTALTKVVAKAIDGHDEDRPGRLEGMEQYAHEVKHDLKNDINVLSLRLTEVSLKLDHNTELTMGARVAAEAAAQKAETAALKAETSAVEKADLLQDIQRHVNGGLREAMNEMLNPIRDEMVKMSNRREEIARDVQAIKEEQSKRGTP